ARGLVRGRGRRVSPGRPRVDLGRAAGSQQRCRHECCPSQHVSRGRPHSLEVFSARGRGGWRHSHPCHAQPKRRQGWRQGQGQGQGRKR
ncbi:unnamed protein product, partial [Polarella glacialis]